MQRRSQTPLKAILLIKLMKFSFCLGWIERKNEKKIFGRDSAELTRKDRGKVRFMVEAEGNDKIVILLASPVQ
jgi:hypothetical protein